MREPTDNLKDLLKMFNCSSKNELKKHAKNIVVYQQDLVALILAAQENLMASYLYANYFNKNIPPHLMPNEKEKDAISKNGIGKLNTPAAQKFANKIFQLPIDSKSRAAHLFYTPDHRYWNLFYFDNRDRLEKNNHWNHGSHIHFVSYLWPNLSIEHVWEKVQTGNLSFSNKLHLKYISDNK